MSTETPAGGGEQKPVVKNNEGKTGNHNRRDQRKFPGVRRDKFEGATAELSGYIFTAGTNRTNQIHNFTRTDERIRTLVGQKFDPHVLQSLEEVKAVTPTKPQLQYEADGVTVSKQEEMRYNMKYKKWIDMTYIIEKEMKNAYAIYYGQCDDEMKATLAMDKDFSTVNKTKDLIGLYKILQKVNFSYTASEEPIVAMWNSKLDFIRIRQHPGETVSEYYDRYNQLKEVNDTLGNNIHDDFGFTEVIAREKGKDLSAMSPDQKDAFSTDAMEEGSKRMAAVHLLMGANRENFGDLITDLKHSYLKNKKNEYPKDLHSAYTLLKGWSNKKIQRNPNKVGVSFNTNGEEDGAVLVNKGGKSPCKKCGRTNHTTEECFAKKREDGTLLHTEAAVEVGSTEASDEVSTDVLHHDSDVYGLMFLHDSPATKMNQKSFFREGIPSTWILLDSQSTIDVFSNGNLLTNIHSTTTTMHIKCNAGSKSTNLRGTLSGYGEVWYFADGIANILSLSRVKEKFRVTFDSAADNSFHVHKPDKVLKFREATRRLYYFDTAERETKKAQCSSLQ